MLFEIKVVFIFAGRKPATAHAVGRTYAKHGAFKSH
jgi:hypothetical protein